MKITKRYKLHGLDTVLGTSHSANNKTFYETYEEALEVAKSYVGRHSAPASGIVIFQAIEVVMPAAAPVVVKKIGYNGEVD